MAQKWLLAACLVAAAGIAVGMILLLGEPLEAQRTRHDPISTEPEVRPQASTKEAPRATQRMPAGETKKSEKPPPATHKGPPPAAVPVVDGNKRKLNQPDGEYEVEAVRGDAVIRLTGKVKTLKVPLVEGIGTLDASGLEAKEIIVAGRIDNQATVKLNAPGGTVRFNGEVQGAATLIVNAPGGSVIFAEPSALAVGRRGSMIDGSAKVTITAKDVNFRGDLLGGARVVVTLTRDGSLKYQEVGGGAVLHYRKTDRNDPDPTITAGTVMGGGKVEKID